MNDRATHTTEVITTAGILYMAFDLGHRQWHLRFGDGRRYRDITMPARDLPRLEEEIGKAKKRFKLEEEAVVRSCFEAGWDGFWLHRHLVGQGIENVIVDSASIEVSRRFRRAKTDRLDAAKLLEMLYRHHRGEKDLWSVLRVPAEEAEDIRQIHREIERLKKDRRQHRNRIESLLVLQGVVEKVGRDFRNRLDQVRCWDGSALPAHLRQSILREFGRLELCEEQLRAVERQQRVMVKEGDTEALRKVAALARLRGIGSRSSWVFVMELFGWRRFRNRREVASSAGLTPMPHKSGGMSREQGISKAGNRRVRWLMVEISWGWLRFQPNSQLSRWYTERFAGGGSRMRRIGIVALARKLLIALWHYVEHGAIPEGAELKAA